VHRKEAQARAEAKGKRRYVVKSIGYATWHPRQEQVKRKQQTGTR
jgi:hypothetical protein